MLSGDPQKVENKAKALPRATNRETESTYHGKIEEVVVDPVVMYHSQACVKTEADENKRDDLEHPQDTQQHGSLLTEWQEFGHP
jgi:hypothetical protein